MSTSTVTLADEENPQMEEPRAHLSVRASSSTLQNRLLQTALATATYLAETINCEQSVKTEDRAQVSPMGSVKKFGILILTTIVFIAVVPLVGTLKNSTHPLIMEISVVFAFMSFAIGMVLQVLTLMRPRSTCMIEKLMWVVLVVSASMQFALIVSPLCKWLVSNGAVNGPGNIFFYE